MSNEVIFTSYLIGEASLLIKCGEILLKNGHTIKGIISNEPKICKWAKENNLKSINPKDDYKTILKNDKFDYLFSIVNYSVLKNDVLELPEKMAINFHDALLPKHAGIHATSWAIMNKEKEHGITWHVMEDGVDEGNILKQKKVTINNRETAFSLNLKCYIAALEAFEELVEELSTNTYTQTPQDLNERSYNSKNKRPKNACVISFDSDAEDIDALVRALDFGNQINRLGRAKIYVNGQFILVPNVEILKTKSDKKAGTVLDIVDDSIIVSTNTFDIKLSNLKSVKGKDLTSNNLNNFGLNKGYILKPDEEIINKFNLYSETAKYENYWINKLLDLQKPIVQEIIRMDENKEEDNYIKFNIDLPQEFFNHIRTLEGTKRFEYLASAFGAFIARVAEEQSFDLGISNLSLKEETKGLENLFSRNVPIRISVGGKESLNELHTSMAKVYENTNKRKTYTYEINERIPEITNTSEDNLITPIIIEQVKNIEEYKPQFDADLALVVNEDINKTNIFYKSNKLIKGKTEELLNRFTIFLSNILTNPATPIMKTGILSEEEYNKIIYEWNHSDYQYPKDKCTYELIEEQALKRPEATAVIYENDSITYKQLNDRTSQIAAYLRKEGVEGGRLIGVLMERSIDMLVALIGIWKAECAYVPLDPIYPKDRLQYMIEESKTPIVLTQSDLVDKLPKTDAKAIEIDTDREKIFTDKLEEIEKTENNKSTKDRLAYVIFTSGSTGKPKGVEITQRNLTNYLWFVVESQNFTEKDKFLALTTICFDISVTELFANLIRGGIVEILPTEMQRDPFKLKDKLENTWATAVQATPATWDMLTTVGWDKKLQLKLYCGGEAMSPEIAEKLIARCDELWNIYGPTEATIWSSISHITSKDHITVGHPVYNAQYYVLDKNLNPVPQGTPGELYIGGDGLARGYLNRPDLTAERFIENPFDKEKSERIYKTGDSVRFLPDGDVDWLGRIDNQVKLRGFRIELGEIETVLKRQEGIEKAYVVLREDKGGFKILYAFLLADESNDISVKTKLKEQLKDSLPDYMIPSHYIYLTEYPLTMNKKVNRKALATMNIDKIQEQYGDNKRNNINSKNEITEQVETTVIEAAAIKEENKSVEEVKVSKDSAINTFKNDLIDVVSEVIRASKEDIEVTIPLGEYGYDSVSFTVLSMRIKEKYEIIISPAIFYTYTTVEKLVEYIYKEHENTLDKYYENYITLEKKVKSGEPKSISQNIIEPLKKDLVNIIADVIRVNVEDLEENIPLGEYGYDSVSFTVLSMKIKEKYEITISPAIFYTYTTIEKLSNYIYKTYSDVMDEYYKDLVKSVVIEEKQETNKAQETTYVNQMENYTNTNSSSKEPIAIIGIGGIMPKSPNMDIFWDNLKNEMDMITEVPNDRWDVNGNYGEGINAGTKENPIRGGFIDDADKFDSKFFSISPREAELMDPQQRIFTETVWSTLEDAGYKPTDLSDSNTGVYVGVVATDYWDLMSTDNELIDAFTTSGRINCVIANRVSYLLNLRGPSATIDTACSSSLVAIHRAVTAIQDGHCEMAIAGGVNVMANPLFHVAIGKKGMLSADGKCKTFDKSADGYVRGEGVGAILLKPLSKAIADNDNIHAVINSTSENHGGRSNSFTVPSAQAQAELIVDAFEKGKISPDTVTYMETHGTGTSLGDPIEINSLKDAFNKLYEKNNLQKANKPYCGVGSVKTNIGHLEAGAGIAGVLKVILSMKEKMLPASINFNELNPYIDFENSPFYLVKNTREWDRLIDKEGNEIPRRAGVSSFGFGGSNSHVVLEEYNNKTTVISNDEPRLFVLSAKNEERLKEYVNNFIDFLENKENIDFKNMAYTLQVGREAMEERLVIITNNISDLKDKLYKYNEGKNNINNLYTSNIKESKKRMELLLGGEEGEEILKLLIRNKNLNKIAQLWLSGVEIDWNILYATKPKRISLPTYPFEKVRHWIPKKELNASVSIIPNANIHPFIDKNISSNNYGKQLYYKSLTKNQENIKDHIANDETVFPGVGYLELARAAGQDANKMTKVRKIKNIIWSKALILEDTPKDVNIELTSKGEGADYIIKTIDEAGESLHAQGKIIYSNEISEDSYVEINSIQERMTTVKDKEECYTLFRESGFQYGETYRSITNLYNNDREVLANIELPEKCRSSYGNFTLHPSLLDGALQSVIVFIGNSYRETGIIYMPFAMGEIEIFHKLPEKCFAYATLTETKNAGNYSVKKFSIIVTDEAGKVLVVIKDFSLRGKITNEPIKIEEEDKPAISYMKVIWEQSSLKESVKSIKDNTLIFGVDDKLYNELNSKKENAQIILVKKGEEYKEVENNIYEINPSNKEDYIKLFNTLNNKKIILTNIIHSWSNGNFNHEEINDELKSSLYSMLYLSQSIIKEKLNKNINLLYVYSGEKGMVSPIFSSIKGFIKVLETENSKFNCKSIGVINNTDISTICINELNNSDKFIKYEDGKRFEEKIVDVNRDINKEIKELPLKNEGVYIITGGAGSLGLIFAKYLANKVKAKLVLLGRSALDEERASKLEELENLGSEVVYLNIDISNKQNVESLIRGTKRRFGEINGIIHCAGALRDSYIINKTTKEVDEVLASKIYGTTFLDEATNDENLDFFVVFSSISGLIGNAAQSDYSYANMFMDDYAKYRERLKNENKRHGKSISISWPLWDEGGMKVDEQIKKLMTTTMGLDSMTTEEGLKSFEIALTSNENHLIVFSGYKNKIKKLLGINKEVKVNKVPKAVIQPKAEKIQKVEPTNISNKSSDDILDKVIKDLIEMTSKVQKLSIKDIDPEGDISEFGFDSITFTEFSNLINDKYDLGIMPSVFFEHSTLNSLGKYLIDEYNNEFNNYFGVSKTEVKEVKEEPVIVNISKVKEEIIELPKYEGYKEEVVEEHNNESLVNKVTKDLISFTSKVLKLNEKDIEPDGDISEFGFDSIAFTELSNEINDKYDIGIMPSVFFEHSTLDSLANHIVSEYEEDIKKLYKDKVTKVKTEVINPEVIKPTSVTNKKEFLLENIFVKDIEEEKVVEEVRVEEKKINEPVAIIGISGVMPGSENLEEFWANIEAEKDLITEIPKDRWDWKEYYGDPVSEANKTNVKWGGFMKEVDKFDPLFFGISPREAMLMDPQQRIFLENVWKSVEDAGYKASDFAGTSTGVFIGAGAWDYLYLLKENDIDIEAQTSSGISFSIMANRVSYLLNLHGPSETIDTACSSSLVALHRAVEAIQEGNCDMAFAGGINVMVNPAIFISLSKAGMLCEDGRCKTFDKSANGYVRGEGCGVILLKPLSKAIKDNDNIYAVIKGTAVNHGGHVNSLTTPNPNAQSELIQEAWRKAGVSPTTISYIEAHGTGTSLGDPIEINGLKKAFNSLYNEWNISKTPNSYCGVGSVKTNIGHLEWGSGIAGILKVILSMKHKKIPASINFKEQNPYIQLENSPFYIANKSREWNKLQDENKNEVPRRAGVSSFGFGGVNAHIALEEYEVEEISDESSKPELIVLSVKSEDRLQDYARELINYIDDNSEIIGEENTYSEDTLKIVAKEIAAIVANIINVNVDEVNTEENLEEYSFDVVSINGLTESISGKYSIDIAPYDISHFLNINMISKYLCDNHIEKISKIHKEAKMITTEPIVNYNINLSNMAYTLQIGREEMEVRLAVIASNPRELKEKLQDYCNGLEREDIFTGNTRDDKEKIEFILSSQKGKEFIDSLVEEGDLQQLGKLWTMGVKVNWSKLHNENKRRIPLPTYPFARERYWVADTVKEKKIKGKVHKLHPLIDRNTSNLYEQRFTTMLDGKDFFLADHVVNKEKILPGVAYLEMANAAGILSGNKKVSKIKDIIWARPITVSEYLKEINISLYPDEEGINYEVMSINEDSSRTVYSQGKLEIEDAISADEYIDLESIKKESKLLQGDSCYSSFKEMDFDYGNGFRTIKEVYSKDNEALSRLQLAHNLKSSLEEFTLHPSIMDGALQTVIGIKTSGLTSNITYVPFTLGEVEIISSLPSSCYAYAKLIHNDGDIKKYNIVITDDGGKVLVKLNNFMMRALASDSINTFYYTTNYVERELTNTKEELFNSNILVLDTDENIYNSLSKDNNVYLIKPSNEFRKISDTVYEINANKLEDYKEIINILNNKNAMPDYILHLWSKESFNNNEDILKKQLELSLYSMFNISKALIELGVNKDIKINYIYKNTNNNVEPQYKSIGSLAKTINIEKPNILIKTIELDNNEDLLNIALKELNSNYKNIEVLYKNNIRYIKANKKVEDTFSESNILYKNNGVYLITGGLGGLGFIFAKHLAEKNQVKLVLTGRSELNETRINKIKELEDLGAKVLYIKCDITNKEEVNNLITKAKENFGEINGVIHGAGVLKDSFIFKKSYEEIDSVISPKVYGTLYLDELTANENLDFFIMFSSITSIYGNVGQSDYGYANSFMDNYVELRENLRKENKRIGQTISINWPLWKDGGMKMDEDSINDMKEEWGLVPINNETGIKAFEDALSSNISNLIVLQGNEKKIDSINDIGEEVEVTKVENIPTKDIKTDSEDVYAKAEDYIKNILSKELNIPINRIHPKEPFEKYGIDSVLIISLNRALENHFGKISKTLLFEYKNLKELAGYFAKNHSDKFIEKAELEVATTKEVSNETKVENYRLSSMDKARFANTDNNKKEEKDDIAIIGVSGRYPMAKNLDEFWENLKVGKDCISEIPKDRWDYREYFDPDKNKKGKAYTKWGGFIDDVDKFDPMFFNITPKEAEFMDPQERTFLETVWHTIEDAGYTREDLEKEKVGVFAGVMYNHYPLFAAEESMKGNMVAVNSTYASIANRVSYYLNLTGPSIALDTMCSSSITAIHLACDSLHKGESNMAIAGGVNVTIHPNKYILLSQGRFASSDGRCRSFGEGGDGYVPGEGVGSVLLKPLKKAVEDGDRIYGVIKGSSLNHGGKTNGYSVPNPNAQGDLILEALKQSNINPRTISYLEAHGTGTSLGDPIEMTGLNKAFSEYTKEKQFCSIGSAKSNIGHLESAAGIAGITKVLLQMKYKTLVPSIHSDVINPNIDFKESPFYIQHKLEEWNKPVVNNKEYPRRAGLSSFGAGGANAHIILEEYEDNRQPIVSKEQKLICLSARDKERLNVYINEFIKYISNNKSNSDITLDSIAYTLQVGREAMEERVSLIVSSIEELEGKLKLYLEGEAIINDLYTGSVRLARFKDEDTNNFARIQELFVNKNLKELAKLWISGESINFRELYKNGKHKIVTLPVYPFARERYWIPESDEKIEVISSNNVMELNPLIHKNISTLKEQRFTTTFKGDEFFLEDHIVDNKKMLPGAAYIEMARVAGDLSEDLKVTKIKDIFWMKPIIHSGELKDINTSLFADEDYVEFEISDEVDGKKTIYSKGKLEYDTDYINSDEIVDIDDIRSRCKDVMNKEEFYSMVKDMGIEYGTSFRVLDKVYQGEKEVLANITLPNIQDNKEFILHPSIVDGMLQSVAGIKSNVSKDGELSLPFSIDEVEIYDLVDKGCYVYGVFKVEDDFGKKFDVYLLDEAGNVIVKIVDFLVKDFRKGNDSGDKKKEEIMRLLNGLYEGEVEISRVREVIDI